MKKNFILAFCFLIFVFLAFVAFFPPKKKFLIDEAYQHFVQSDYIAAELALSKVEKGKPSVPFYNYRAFLSLAKKDFVSADQLFYKALLSTYDENEKGKLFIGKALSDYYQNKISDMAPLLEKAKRIDNSKELLLIDALYQYETGHFARACQLFAAFAEKTSWGNHWFEAVITRDLTQKQLEIFWAHALIEEKKYTEARALLEKNIEHVPSATLFLGYSYLKESTTLPFAEKKSFLNVAHCYFDRSFDACIEERKKIAPAITAEVKGLLKGDEECFFAFFFIHLLEKWNCGNNLQDIATQILDKMILDGQFKALAFCNTLKEEFKEGLFHDIVLRRLFFLTEGNLKDKKLKNPFEAWQKIETFATSYPKDLMHSIVMTTQNQILSLFQEEKGSFNRTIKYLKFWKTIESDEFGKKEFSRALLTQGMLFWRTENQEKKGSYILKIALHIADDASKKEFSKEVEDFFKALYRQASAVNMVSRLSLIYDAMQEFKIPFKGLLSRDELANHLADAEHFFKIHNYISAKDHAEWVVKVEPTNVDALKLVGLSSFHLGYYSTALAYLKRIAEPDEEITNTLLLCETHLKEEEKKTPLAQLDLFALE